MSRYTGPRLRKCRRVGVDLPGLTTLRLERRPTPPGEPGKQRRFRRPSDYAIQLAEKQKLKFNYGVTESQMVRLLAEAKRRGGVAGEELVRFLERRLDNVLFRAGFAPTIPAARQLVNHGHVRVRGQRVDIPSYRVRVGDEIAFRPRPGIERLVEEALARAEQPVPPWLRVDQAQQSVVVLSEPEAVLLIDCDLQLVVEFYAR